MEFYSKYTLLETNDVEVKDEKNIEEFKIGEKNLIPKETAIIEIQQEKIKEPKRELKKEKTFLKKHVDKFVFGLCIIAIIILIAIIIIKK